MKAGPLGWASSSLKMASNSLFVLAATFLLVGSASGISISIVRARIKYVVEVEVSHVYPASGFGELFVANGSRRDGEGSVP